MSIGTHLGLRLSAAPGQNGPWSWGSGFHSTGVEGTASHTGSGRWAARGSNPAP